ncbi:MAG: hypothetical protein KDA93_10370 [Planctomycetaceae bacterium]|nr:hypothetical protein [Planctomycetaceae bacterium]
MKCPECGSLEVYRSSSQNKPHYKYFCVARFRCNKCAHLYWQTTFIHTLRYLLSENYREYVYWSELGSGLPNTLQSQQQQKEALRGPTITSRLHARFPWPAFDERW